jgi:hypothetical protein
LKKWPKSLAISVISKNCPELKIAHQAKIRPIWSPWILTTFRQSVVDFLQISFDCFSRGKSGLRKTVLV